MNITRMWGILLQEYYFTKRSVEVLMDLFIYPLISVFIFGLISMYLSQNAATDASRYVLMGMLLWQIFWIVEYSVSIGSLWNIWSKNLSNLFISPMHVREYICAQAISGLVKALIMLVLLIALSRVAFGFDLLTMGVLPLSMSVINISVLQALTWGLVPIFQPLCAAYFPLQVLPEPLRTIALLFPGTYIFESARYSLTHSGVIDWRNVSLAIFTNIVLLVISWWYFSTMVKLSKKSGQFAKNES
jgi:ABC-2 type transport system permease protein